MHSWHNRGQNTRPVVSAETAAPTPAYDMSMTRTNAGAQAIVHALGAAQLQTQARARGRTNLRESPSALHAFCLQSASFSWQQPLISLGCCHSRFTAQSLCVPHLAFQLLIADLQHGSLKRWVVPSKTFLAGGVRVSSAVGE